MPNVHHIAKAQPTEIDYHGEHIVIEYRKDTNDYSYTFVITRAMPFTGHGSSYDDCVDKAQKRIDAVTGGA